MFDKETDHGLEHVKCGETEAIIIFESGSDYILVDVDSC